MKLENLIPGEIYYQETMYNYIFIFESFKGNNIKGHYCITDNSLTFYQTYNNNYSETLRIATQEERGILLSYIQTQGLPMPVLSTPIYEIY